MIFEQNGFYFHLNKGQYVTYCWTGVDNRYTIFVLGTTEAQAREAIKSTNDGHFGGGLVACDDRTRMEAFDATYGDQCPQKPEGPSQEQHTLVADGGRGLANVPEDEKAATDESALATACGTFINAVEPIIDSINGPDRIPDEDATRAERELILFHQQLGLVMIERKIPRSRRNKTYVAGVRQSDNWYDKSDLFVPGEASLVRNAIVTFLTTVGDSVSAIRNDSWENCSGEEEKLSNACGRLSEVIQAIDLGKTRCWPFAEPGANDTVKAAVQALQPHIGVCDALLRGLNADAILADLATAEMQQGFKYVVWEIHGKAGSRKQTGFLVCNVEKGCLDRIEHAAGPTVDDETFKSVIGLLPHYLHARGYIRRFDADVAACILSAIPERKLTLEPPFSFDLADFPLRRPNNLPTS
jgi:hypothetical protein